MIYIWNFVAIMARLQAKYVKQNHGFLKVEVTLKVNQFNYIPKNVKWLTSSPPSVPSISSDGEAASKCGKSMGLWFDKTCIYLFFINF